MIIKQDTYILHIDTATSICSIALSANGILVKDKLEEKSNSHTRLINVMIEALLDEASVSMQDLSAISVAIGPGSYTGLRVGLSVAKGLAYALNIPIIPIGTLEALAETYRDNDGSKNIIAALDARRNEVYMAIFDSKLNLSMGDHSYIIGENDYPEHWPPPESLIVCGNGAEKIASLLSNYSFLYHIDQNNASNQSRLAYKCFKEANFSDIAYIRPNYLKPPNITKSKKSAF